MNREEIKARFEYLYDRMKTSRNPEYMKIYGAVTTNLFEKLAEKHPELAEEVVDGFETILWNNYLSQKQAKMIADKIINQDGKQGPKWSEDLLFHAVEQLGGQIEKEPYYNRYALWLVMNAHYSDHAVSTSQDMGFNSVADVPPEMMALSMYKKAVESLTDVDRLNYVERYYWRELHEKMK